jgi:DNA-binding LytR/AlgR family response regulator
MKLKHNGAEIALSDILYLESDWNYTRVHLLSGDTVMSSRHLAYHIARHLNEGFMRIHRGICINLSHVQGYDYPPNPSFIYLAGGAELPIARRRRSFILKNG